MSGQRVFDSQILDARETTSLALQLRSVVSCFIVGDIADAPDSEDGFAGAGGTALVVINLFLAASQF